MTFKAIVGVAGSPVPSDALHLVPGENLRTGVEDFSATYSDITTLESDLLTLASAILACDLAFKRGEREEIIRGIELRIPVVNFHVLDALRPELELVLWTLSHDNWSLTFTWADGVQEAKKKWPTGAGSTILFSGGVDSFVGAIDLLQAGDPSETQLASHITGNPVTRQSQDDLIAHLESRFGDGVVSRRVRTGGRRKGVYLFPSDNDREETQRTRSFTFLAIAALFARRSGHSKLVVIAENGQMAIHLPLSAARIGAFSTHTAHPEFVSQATSFFSTVLGYKFDISNPYLYMTKAELVSRLTNSSDRGILNKSVSCWRGSRVASALNHCGQCVPCLVRRIAFESNGVVLPEYKDDLFSKAVASLPEDNDGKRNLVELAEFAHAFNTQSDAVLELLFPDLICPDFDKSKAISMYRRFAKEADCVLRKYPGPAALLPAVSATPKKGKGAAL